MDPTMCGVGALNARRACGLARRAASGVAEVGQAAPPKCDAQCDWLTMV